MITIRLLLRGLFHKRILTGVGIGVLLVFPFIFSREYLINVSIFTGIFVVLLVGLSLFIGHVGQFSFAQAAFYGMGAYTSSLLTTRLGVAVWLGFLAAGALPGLTAYAIGSLTLRLRGYYLAMVTLALCGIFHVFVTEQYSITGGPSGVYGIPPLSLGKIRVESAASYHYVVWTIAVLSLIFSRNITKSRVGRALKAIEGSEDAATVLGIDVSGYKIKIFTLTGVSAGVAGSLFAHYVTYIAPGNFTLDLSIWLVVILAIGGVRNISGVVMGAGFTTIFPFLLGPYQKYNMLVFGIILVLVLMFFPGGITGVIGRKIEGAKAKLLD